MALSAGTKLGPYEILAPIGESGFRLAWEAIEERDPNITFTIRSPYFQLLHSDPLYDDLLRRMNLQP